MIDANIFYELNHLLTEHHPDPDKMRETWNTGNKVKLLKDAIKSIRSLTKGLDSIEDRMTKKLHSLEKEIT